MDQTTVVSVDRWSFCRSRIGLHYIFVCSLFIDLEYILQPCLVGWMDWCAGCSKVRTLGYT